MEDGLDLESSTKVPYVIKDKTLMSPGIWNNYYYSTEQIIEAFNNTNWEDRAIRSLFLDHEDLRSSEWIGEVTNVKMNGEKLIGDLVIVDKPTAMKLAYGAKMGISPKVHGKEDGGKMLNFLFDNMSVVINPAVKTAYINNQEKIDEVEKMTEEKIENAQPPVPEQETVAEKKPEEEKVYPEPVQMAEADMIDQIIKLASALKEKKMPVPEASAEVKKEELKVDESEMAKKKEEVKAPEMAEKVKEEVKEEVKKEMSALIASKDKVIAEMSEKISEIEKRFNKPVKETVVENSSINLPFSSNHNSVDVGFFNYLKNMRN